MVLGLIRVNTIPYHTAVRSKYLGIHVGVMMAGGVVSLPTIIGNTGRRNAVCMCYAEECW